MIRFSFLSILLALPVVAWCQEPNLAAGELMNLEQAVALALENNRLVKTAALEMAKAEDQLAVARMKRLPSFDFNVLASVLLTRLDFQFKQGAFGTFPGGVLNPSTDVNISTPRRLNTFVFATANQPLSQLYRIGLGLRLGAINSDIAREKLRSRRQSVANDVRQAYYGLLQTQSALDATREAIKLYRELDRITGEYVIQQVALKSQSLEVKTRLAKAEYDALTLQNTLATQKERLNDLLGRDLRTEFTVSPVPELTAYEVDLASAQARALGQRPEVKEAHLKAKQAEVDQRLKKSEFIPDVSLSFRYISPFGIEVLPKNITAAGLLFSWEPFDWGRKKRELAEKSRTTEQASDGLHQAESSVLMEINSRFRKLQECKALLRVSQLTQETQREELRVTMNRYTHKASLLNDVLQAETSLAEANHQYRQALLSYWVARADFEKALGEE